MGKSDAAKRAVCEVNRHSWGLTIKLKSPPPTMRELGVTNRKNLRQISLLRLQSSFAE